MDQDDCLPTAKKYTLRSCPSIFGRYEDYDADKMYDYLDRLSKYLKKHSR